MKISILAAAASIFIASCSTQKPAPIHFEDRPSSLAPSAYRQGAQPEERQTVAGSDSFLSENHSALNRAIVTQSSQDEAKRREREAARAASSSYGAPSSGSASSQPQARGDYEDCVCTYDKLKGVTIDSGTNTIRFRTSRSSWTVSYDFTNSNCLMRGPGNLEGHIIKVRFNNGRPDRLECAAGRGYCNPTSTYRE